MPTPRETVESAAHGLVIEKLFDYGLACHRGMLDDPIKKERERGRTYREFQRALAAYARAIRQETSGNGSR